MSTSFANFTIFLIILGICNGIIRVPAPVMGGVELFCADMASGDDCKDDFGPVIGIFFSQCGSKDYKNGCEACKDNSVEYFIRYNHCPTIQERRCSEYKQAICGRDSTGKLVEFESECDACKHDVEFYLVRNCPSQ